MTESFSTERHISLSKVKHLDMCQTCGEIHRHNGDTQ